MSICAGQNVSIMRETGLAKIRGLQGGELGEIFEGVAIYYGDLIVRQEPMDTRYIGEGRIASEHEKGEITI